MFAAIVIPMLSGALAYSPLVYGATQPLHRRQGVAASSNLQGHGDACADTPMEEYTLGLHIGSIFILFVASMLGVVIPFVGNWLGKMCSSETSARLSSISQSVTFAMRHFGGGIILSTAFIHLLYEAFVTFNNKCIGHLAFDATSPTIAMATVYLLFLLDFLLLRSKRREAYYPELNVAAQSTFANVATPHSFDVETDGGSLSEKTQEARDILARCNVFAIESGIIFHSVIIGVTIGTSSGSGWLALMIAITFHQFCEGIGTASRVATLSKTAAGSLQVFCMCGAFCLTTPVGIAIGIGIRQSFNENSRSSLLAIGTLDSISAGILLYSSFIQILVPDFFYNKAMLEADLSHCFVAIFWFTAGTLVMTVIGHWA